MKDRTSTHVNTIGPRPARPVVPIRSQAGVSALANALYPQLRHTPHTVTARRTRPAPMIGRLPVQHGGLHFNRTTPLNQLPAGTLVQAVATVVSVRQIRNRVDVVLTDQAGNTIVGHLDADTALTVAALLTPGRTVRTRGRTVRRTPDAPQTINLGGMQAVTR